MSETRATSIVLSDTTITALRMHLAEIGANKAGSFSAFIDAAVCQKIRDEASEYVASKVKVEDGSNEDLSE